MKIRNYIVDFDLPVDDAEVGDIALVKVFLTPAGESLKTDVHPNIEIEPSVEGFSVANPTISADLTTLIAHYVAEGAVNKDNKFDVQVLTIDAVGNYDSPAILEGLTFDITPPPRVVNLRLR